MSKLTRAQDRIFSGLFAAAFLLLVVATPFHILEDGHGAAQSDCPLCLFAMAFHLGAVYLSVAFSLALIALAGVVPPRRMVASRLLFSFLRRGPPLPSHS
jgi:hypothetical protein